MAGEYVLSVVLKAQDAASNVVGGFMKTLEGLGPVAGVAGGLIIGAGAAIVGFGVASAKMAADYQQQMNMVQSLTGSTNAQMQQYKNSIRGVSDETGKSSIELSKGLYQVISAGFQGADATKVLGLAAKDSVIGLTDQETTTKALVVAMNSYKIGAKDADNVSNQMLKTTALGRMSLSDYAGALATGAAAAHGNGVSMAEMNATLATLTSGGVKTAGIAMTDLTNLTGVMDGKTDMMTKRIRAQGISFDETKFKTLSYSDQVKYLGDKLSGLSYGQKQAVLGSKNAAQALEILSKNSKMYKDDVAKLSDKQQMAKDSATAWAKTQSGFNQTWTRMKTQLDNVMISVGDKLLPVLGKLMDKVSPLIKQFADWMQNSGAVDKATDGLTTGIGYLSKGFELVWPYIAQAGKAAMDFGKDIAIRLIPIINQVVTTFKVYWPTIQTIVSGVFDAVKGIIQIAWSIISGIVKIALDLMSGNWKQAWNDLLDMLKGVWSGIQSFVKGEVKILLGYIQGILTTFGFMKNGVQKSADDMKRQAEMKTDQMRANSLAHTQAMAMGSIKNLEKQRLGIIAQLQQTKDPAVRHMLEMKLKTVEQSELQQKGVVQKANDMRIQTMLHMKKLHDDEIEAHKSMWDKSMDFAKGFASGFVGKMQSMGSDAWKQIQNTWHNIQTSFERAWSDNVSTPLNNFGKSVSDFFTNLPHEAQTWGQNLIQGFIDGINNMAGAAGNAASGIVQNVKNFLGFHSPAKQGPGADADTWAPNLMKMLAHGIQGGLPTIKAAVTEAAKLMQQGLTGQGNQMYQAINAAQNSMANGKEMARYDKYLADKHKRYEKYLADKQKALDKYNSSKTKHKKAFSYHAFNQGAAFKWAAPKALALGAFANHTGYSDPFMDSGQAIMPSAGGTVHYHTHTLNINAPHMDAKALAKAVNEENNKKYRMSGTHITNTSGAKV